MAGGQQKKGGRGGHSSSSDSRKKEAILDLSKYLEKRIIVKYQGGRQVAGVLKGFDPLQNLVMDETVEYIRDGSDPSTLTDETRDLGLIVCRGTAVVFISPAEWTEEKVNPFL